MESGSHGPPGRAPVAVVAAVIEREGCILLTLRQDGAHLAGHWEFPGGKVQPGETHAEALRRELHEELDIVVDVGALVHRVTHAYPERTVALYFYACACADEPKPMLGQEIRWVPRGELAALRFPEADRELVERLGG